MLLLDLGIGLKAKFLGLGLEFLALALNALTLNKITRPSALVYK